MNLVKICDLPRKIAHRIRVEMLHGRLHKYIGEDGRIYVDKEEYLHYQQTKSKGGRPQKPQAYVEDYYDFY